VKAPDAKALEEFLQLLARGVQQFHTYPAGSPMCQQAVDAALRALVSLDSRDEVTFRVTPRDLIVDEEPAGRGTLIEIELARRLHAAFVAQVTIERAASSRELARFCGDLVRVGDRSESTVSLIELLTEHGVDRISLRAADRPEVLTVTSDTTSIQHLLDHERRRQSELFAGGGPVNHLYPPGKGWIRVDPSARLDTISLIDLALLADDPSVLARMLMRLTDGDSAETAPEEALSQKYSDVTRLFAAMDPRVARAMFAKLARAVLNLDSNHRQALLKRTILPGLLDGRMDGAVLRDFPDLELADSLCLLLDLEAAAPDVVTAALSRLELPAERQAAMLPLLEERVQTKISKTQAQQENTVDSHARRLVKIDRERVKNVAEFAAFDLALDRDTRDTLTQIREGIAATDVTAAQLDCLWKLTRLEPNPETVEQFAANAQPLLEALERENRWPTFAAWMGRYRDLTEALKDARPDVADVLRKRLSELCTPERAARVIALAEQGGDGREQADTIVSALGANLGLRLLELVTTASGRTAAHIICDHATLLAPVLAAAAERAEPAAQRVIARALGLAGAGHEATLGMLLRSSDEHTIREALRALARIGTAQAASLVAARIHDGHDWVVAAAEQTLWHFPKPEADRQVISLLSRREFIERQPDAAERLIDHAPNVEATVAVLQPLQTLRYRIWKPSLARIGRKARARLAG
jgi:hypothetical protein